MSVQIRDYVRSYGWQAALNHPVIGPLIRKMRAEQKAFQDKLDR